MELERIFVKDTDKVIYKYKRFGVVKNGECNKTSKIQNRSAL